MLSVKHTPCKTYYVKLIYVTSLSHPIPNDLDVP